MVVLERPEAGAGILPCQSEVDVIHPPTRWASEWSLVISSFPCPLAGVQWRPLGNLWVHPLPLWESTAF